MAVLVEHLHIVLEELAVLVVVVETVLGLMDPMVQAVAVVEHKMDRVVVTQEVMAALDM